MTFIELIFKKPRLEVYRPCSKDPVFINSPKLRRSSNKIVFLDKFFLIRSFFLPFLGPTLKGNSGHFSNPILSALGRDKKV